MAISVNITSGVIEWRVNDTVRYKLDCKLITVPNVKWVYCVGISNGSCISIIY